MIVDLQRGTAALPTAHPIETVITNARRLADFYRSQTLPIAYVTSAGTPSGRTTYSSGERRMPEGWNEPLPDFSPVDADILESRSTWSAFAGTGLDARLRALEVNEVVLVGLATSFGIESTARAAYDLGYHVVVVSDAVTDPRIEVHENSVNAVFPALGMVTTTQELLTSRSPQ